MQKDSLKKTGFFYVLIRAWNSFRYFNRCIDSVLSQTYKNYKILYVDDASDLSKTQAKIISEKLKNHTVNFNRVRKYSLFNAWNMIHKFAVNDEAIVVNLDGDDWLIDENVLSYLAEIYKKTNCLLTYGECLIWDGQKGSRESRFIKEFTNIPYPEEVIKNNSYRKYPFLPLHPRTFKVWLFKKIKKESFLRSDGSWLRFAEDQAIFYPMLEMVAGRYKAIEKPLYIYNTFTDNSDIKKNLLNLLKDELIIRKKKSYETLP